MASSLATLRCAGAASSSGRASALPAVVLLRARGSAVRSGRCFRVRSSDPVRSAPPLSDDPPTEPQAPVPQAAPPTPPRASATASNFNAIVAMAGVGAVETAYLTYVKLFGGPLVCPTNGCESVLASPYAQLFGLPLPLFGTVAYAAVAVLAAVAGAAAASDAAPAARQPALAGLAAGAAALATTSAVLMSILQTRLGGTPCAWCYLSAALSASIAITLITSTSGRELRDSALGGVAGAAVTGAVLFAGLPWGGAGGAVYDDDFQLPYTAPVVRTESSDRATSLAARLTAAGARMYGAFWCSHCLEQKEVFGAQAMADFPYVECFPNGWKKGEKPAPACEAANVRAFPTWVIGGKTIEGELELGEVERELARVEREAAAAVAVAAP